MAGSTNKAKKKTGRPPKFPGEGKRPTLTFRVRGGMHEQLKASAAAAVRSISEEIEWRLAKSYEWERAFQDLDAFKAKRAEYEATVRTAIVRGRPTASWDTRLSGVSTAKDA